MNKINTIYVNPVWLNAEDCKLPTGQFNVGHLEAKNKISRERKKYVEGLKRMGLIVITNGEEVDEGTIYFNMHEYYLKEVQPEILESLIFKAGGPNLKFPITVTVEEFFRKPFFPAVLKNEYINAGIDKFLIENEIQLERIKQLYMDNPELQQVFRQCIFQQLITTPTEYSTYMRVLMGASGKILGASLRYSKGVSEERGIKGVLEEYFLDPNSKYYLNCKRMFNYYSGGEIIHLPNNHLNQERSGILIAHGIDPATQEIPFEIVEVMQSIMKNCHLSIGLLCGFDFILNEKDRKWYYLENQSSPAIDEWAYQKGIRIPPLPKNERARWNHMYDTYILGLRLRHEELMRCLGLSYTYEEIMNPTPPEQPTQSAEIPKRKSKVAQTGGGQSKRG